jgi:hypothetical protein
MDVMLYCEYVLASDYDALAAELGAVTEQRDTAHAATKILAKRIGALGAALRQIETADCRGEVCKGIARTALGREGEHE